MPEEDFEKKYGSNSYKVPAIDEEYSGKKYGDDEYSVKKYQGPPDYANNNKFGAYDYKIQEESSKKYGSEEYSSQKYEGSDYKKPENEFSAQKFGGYEEDYSKKYGGSLDYSSKKDEDYSKKYGKIRKIKEISQNNKIIL